VAGVFLLPIVVVALDRLIKRSPRLVPLVTAFLLWALIANVAVLVPRIEGHYRGLAESMKARVLGVATQPHLEAYGPFAPFGVEGNVLTVAQIARIKADGAWPDLRSVPESNRLDAAALLGVGSSERAADIASSPPVPMVATHQLALATGAEGCVTMTPRGAAPSFTLDTRNKASVRLQSPTAGTVHIKLRSPAGAEGVGTDHPLGAGRNVYLGVDAPGTSTVFVPAGLDSLSICNVQVPPTLLQAS
jgi:hypothetical protein